MEEQEYNVIQLPGHGEEETVESSGNAEVDVTPGESDEGDRSMELIPNNDSMTSSFIPTAFDQRARSSWSEDRIMGLLTIYIKEHPAYLKAKAERQVTEFHEYIGRLVSADGTIVAGLLKNLGREYRKAWARCYGVEPPGGLRLRKSRDLCQKFERYYELYSRIGLRELRPTNASGRSRTPMMKSPGSTPTIKKLKKQSPQFAEATVLEHVLSPAQKRVPPMTMSDKHWQEYIDVMREQNSALVEIGKELRLMRMGYFTEHELAMDA